MDVRCDRCQTEYELEDDSVAERGASVQCTTCGHTFVVSRRKPDAHAHARPDDRDGGARLGADHRGREDPPVPRSDHAAEMDRRASRRPRPIASRRPGASRAGWATWTSCGRSSIWSIRPTAPRRRAVARPTQPETPQRHRRRRARLRVARRGRRRRADERPSIAGRRAARPRRRGSIRTSRRGCRRWASTTAWASCCRQRNIGAKCGLRAS